MLLSRIIETFLEHWCLLYRRIETVYQKITLIFVKVPKRVGREFFGTDKLFWSILYAFDAGIYSAKCKFAKVQLQMCNVHKWDQKQKGQKHWKR